MANGLDTRTGMHGLMEGFAFADGIMARREQREQAREETEYQKTVVRPQQERATTLQLDTAEMQYGRAKDESQIKDVMLATSYQANGDNTKMDELIAQNPSMRRYDYRFYDSDEFARSSAQIMKAMNSETQDDINDPAALQAMSSFHPEFIRAGEVPIKGISGIVQLDDAHMPEDAKKAGAGYAAVFVKAQGKDGKEYNASRTVNQSTDPNDKTIAFPVDQMIERTYGAMEIGNNVRKLKTPQEKAAFFNAQLSSLYQKNFTDNKKSQYVATTAYDQKTGTKRAAMVNKNNPQDFYWLGGAAADGDEGESGSGTGSGRSGKKNQYNETLKQYLADEQQIRGHEFATPEERDAAYAGLKNSYAGLAGFDPDAVPVIRNNFRKAYGREPSMDEIQQTEYVMRTKAGEYEKAQQVAQEQEAQNTGPGLADGARAPKSPVDVQHENFLAGQKTQEARNKEIASREAWIAEAEKDFALQKKLGRLDEFMIKSRTENLARKKAELANLKNPKAQGLADISRQKTQQKTPQELLSSRNPADIAGIDAIIFAQDRSAYSTEMLNELTKKKIQLMTAQRSGGSNNTAESGL